MNARGWGFIRAGIIISLIGICGCASNPRSKVAPVVPRLEMPVDVWLMPLEGFPRDYAVELQRTLSAELGLNIKVTVDAGRSRKMFGASGQMIAEQAEQELQEVRARLHPGLRTICLALVPDDLNGSDGTTRFVFAYTFYRQRFSIVSIARMKGSFYQGFENPEVTKARLYKMVKKAIGTLYYHYPRSTDLKSVMYSPVMSLEDLDAVGTAF